MENDKNGSEKRNQKQLLQSQTPYSFCQASNSYSQSTTNLSPIYHMLMEMAGGNFSLKIDTSEIDDELQQLEKLIQLIAAELRKKIYYKGFITSHFALQYLVQNTFVLNKSFIIKSYNSHAEKSLNLEPDFLQDYKFENILSKSSKLLWEIISKEINSNRLFHKTIQLEYQIKSAPIIPTFSTITRLLHSNKIIISSLSIVLENDTQVNHILLNLHHKNESTVRHDNLLINNIYQYILSNLDSPLPSLKDLAAKFATNEHKLKQGFKHYFQTSVYKFYNDERLKRAHLLIQQTKLPLKNIADKSGFNIYSNFSKAFKKQFSYSPISSQTKQLPEINLISPPFNLCSNLNICRSIYTHMLNPYPNYS